MGEPEFLEKLSHIDLKKAEHKAIKVIVGFVGGFLLVHLVYKFVDDNFDFRVKRISNRPESLPPSA